MRVTHVWGETEAFAREAAEAARIEQIVERPEQMIGAIDAVAIDHRHPKHHLPAAEAFLEARLPMFIDKPFCWRAERGRDFLRRAREAGVPVTSFSTVPLQRSFAHFARRLPERAGRWLGGSTWGRCDLESPYGGAFFYGIHQVEMALAAFGPEVAAVQVARDRSVDGDAVATLFYGEGRTVALHLIKQGSGFHITALGERGSVHKTIRNDRSPYLTGVRRFVRMFRTGVEPVDHESILRPIRVLEAMERSVESGEVEQIA